MTTVNDRAAAAVRVRTRTIDPKRGVTLVSRSIRRALVVGAAVLVSVGAASMITGADARAAGVSVAAPSDPIEITAHHVDLGDPNWDWVFSVPGGPAPLVWEIDSSGVLRPHLVATIHLNNANGTCARVNLRYYDASNTLLDHHAGGPACATDNDHHEFSVDQNPYADNDIDHIKVQLETQNSDGSWSVLDSTTADIAP
jgi:hypothetical protein